MLGWQCAVHAGVLLPVPPRFAIYFDFAIHHPFKRVCRVIIFGRVALNVLIFVP